LDPAHDQRTAGADEAVLPAQRDGRPETIQRTRFKAQSCNSRRQRNRDGILYHGNEGGEMHELREGDCLQSRAPTDCSRATIRETLNMQLYVTYRSPYARLARIIVIEKALEDRVEIIEAKTRATGSPYYLINPSGRVPYLVDDAGVGMEDSQVICAYLDGLDGRPRFHDASRASDWAYLRLEFAARSMCDGIAVWGREMARPESERSPTTLAHESARAQRMADFFEDRASDPLMQGGMAHLILAVAVEMARKRGLGDFTSGRRRLASFMRAICDLPSMQRTAPP
jgi:glutathione S-transferase